ncbi:MAG: hypothetical protein HXN43_04955 [Prevotella micans]|nr:hypothetical protein [Prevotella micans]
MGKIALRQVPKTRKSKKQSFALARNSEKRKNTSSHRSESSKILKTRLRSGAKHQKLKKHLFALERERGLSSGSLSFAREFRGTGKKRAYLLNVAGKSAIWVVISKGKLVVVPEPSGKSTGTGSKHGGSGNDSGTDSKPGDGTGGGSGGCSPNSGREEDPRRR